MVEKNRGKFNLLNRTGQILGFGIASLGAVMGLTGMGDFLTTNEVSRKFMELSQSSLSSTVVWAAENFALIPTYLKMVGGSGMVYVGAMLAILSSKKRK